MNNHTKEAKWNLNYDKIPEYMQPGLRRWIEDGIQPGDFLSAVLCNSLIDALMRADDHNREVLRDYASWLYNEAPGGSWGSVQRCKDWAEKFGRGFSEYQR